MNALHTLLEPKIGHLDILQTPTRNGFGKGLVAAGTKDPRVVALTADLKDSTKVADFAKAFPERFVEVGVAEQNMMGMAAGLALSGKIPFVSSYATFSPGRNWDQLRVSVCYSQANVKVIGCHTGLSVGPDGATHQALEDIALVRVLPHMTVVVPCDAVQAEQATRALAEHVGPAYLRLTREATPHIVTDQLPFEIGKAQVWREGDDVAIIGAGPILYNALFAAAVLAGEGIQCTIINSHTIKPLDADTILAAVRRCKAVVTVEEHQMVGGLGSAVAELLGEACPVPLERVGMPDSFGESGAPEELFQKYGMDGPAVVKAVRRALARKL